MEGRERPSCILLYMSSASHNTPLEHTTCGSVECRACEVVCERVVYPSHCLRSSCGAVYSYAEGDTTYFGCVHKVFRAEIDLAPHLDRPRADVYGAWKMRRDALAPCRVAVAEAYSFRYSFRGCVNPTFRQDPADYTPEAVRQLVEGSPETPC